MAPLPDIATKADVDKMVRTLTVRMALIVGGFTAAVFLLLRL